MARETMAAAIAGVRRMIGDTAATPEFDDDAIEAALDEHRVDAPEVELAAVISRAADGTEQRLAYQAPVHPWEEGAQLVGHDGAILASATADEQRGYWTFDTDTAEPVSATGRYFDHYGAAADLLDEWAARLARGYDFAAGGQTFNRSQRVRNLRAAANDFRRRGFVVTVGLVRSDELSAPAAIRQDRF